MTPEMRAGALFEAMLQQKFAPSPCVTWLENAIRSAESEAAAKARATAFLEAAEMAEDHAACDKPEGCDVCVVAAQLGRHFRVMAEETK